MGDGICRNRGKVMYSTLCTSFHWPGNGVATPTSTFLLVVYFLMGRAVAQLVDALRQKPGGRGFDSR